MKNAYFVHFAHDFITHELRLLCRKCIRTRRAAIRMTFTIGTTEVCEQCGARQVAIPYGAWVMRKGKKQFSMNAPVGRLVGLWGDKAIVNWIAPNRIGGDGWHRSTLEISSLRIADAEWAAKAERYVQTQRKALS